MFSPLLEGLYIEIWRPKAIEAQALVEGALHKSQLDSCQLEPREASHID